MSTSLTKETLNIVKNIEKLLNTENRNDRVKALERENLLLRGNLERSDDRIRALENYFGIELVHEHKYKLKN